MTTVSRPGIGIAVTGSHAVASPPGGGSGRKDRTRSPRWRRLIGWLLARRREHAGQAVLNWDVLLLRPVAIEHRVVDTTRLARTAGHGRRGIHAPGSQNLRGPPFRG